MDHILKGFVKMASYTSLTKAQASEILSLYPFEKIEILDIIPMGHGISNSNFKVVLSDNTLLLLKISNDKSLKEIEQELIILDLLKSQNYPYSLAPYQTKNKRLAYEYENLHGVVFPFVHGHVASIDKKHCFLIGQALGQLHLLSQPLLKNPQIRHYSEIGFHLQSISHYCQSPTALEPFKKSFMSIFDDDFIQQVAQSKLPQGVIHGDLYFDNVLFDDNDNIVAILDFEQAGIGSMLLDIGISISGTCLSKDRLNSEFIDSYLDGYLSEKSLSATEMTYIHEAIVVGLYSIALWRIKRFNEKQITEDKKDSYLELVQRAEKFNNKRYIYGQ
jgi:homoserine kinase type II